MTLTTPVSAGDTLASRYRLDAPLGKGAMGEVFRGHDLELRRDVAVKLLAAVEIADESRLMNEARAAAALNHPGLVAIYDVGRHGEAPFLVMELVPGADLRARPPRDLDAITRMTLQLLDALGHAHGNGIVHRDLKPANVLVSDSGALPQYKITDFGLALSRGGSRITNQGLVVGTAAYLAPEQALGRTIDGRADLYALGVMLYELIAGRLPFDGHDALTIVSQHVHAPVTPPRTFRSDIPSALERFVLRLLAKAPEERFATTAEAKAAIAEVLGAMARTDAAATQAMPVASAPPSSDAVGVLEQLVRGRLVGREDELSQLRALWERALQGQGHLALVSGEPGSGKTRLARELLVQAQVAGAVVLRGGCYEYEATTPYLPFVEALRLWVASEPDASLRDLVGENAAELAKLAPEIGERLGALPSSQPLPAHEERLRLFDHVARFFQRLAARRGLLFFADDLQWADQGTLALLHYLLRHLASHRFLALGTYREVELDRRHPLAAALVDWNRERLATRIALGRLTGEETDRMLAVLLGQDTVSAEFGRAIFGETEGNPFFVEEVVKSLIDQGQIYRGGGEWQRGAVAELSIPQSVKSAIGKRLDRLSETCTEVLRAAAALGKLFEFDELSACAGVAEGPLLDALDEAIAAQLVLPDGKDFAFSHDKIREVLYEEMNPVRRRRLHQRIGEGLEKLHASRLDAHAQDLAHHFFESGDLERGLRYGMQAAEAARKVFAFEEAVHFFQRSRECAEGLDRPDLLRGIDIAIGAALDAAGRSGEAGAALERALERSTEEAERVWLASRIAKHYVNVGDPRAEKFAERALLDSSPDRHPMAFALATAVRARVEHLRGHHDQALDLLTQAHGVIEHEGQVDLLEDIYGWLAGACQHLARLDESDGWARKLQDLGARMQIATAEANGIEFQGENSCWRGRVLRACELSDKEIAIADRIHAADRRAWALFYRGIALTHRGRLAEAEATVRESLDLCHRIGEQRLAAFDLANLAWVLYRRGRFEEANGFLEASVRESERMRLSFVLTEARHVAAQKAAIEQNWERVLEEVTRARQIRIDSDAKLNELEIGALEVQALVQLGRLEEARPKIEAGSMLAKNAPSELYAGMMGRAEGLWLTRSGEHAAAHAKLDEAISRLDACELAYDAAEARLIRAEVRRALGDLTGAREDAQAAVDAFEACGAEPAMKKAREVLAGF